MPRHLQAELVQLLGICPFADSMHHTSHAELLLFIVSSKLSLRATCTISSFSERVCLDQNHRILLAQLPDVTAIASDYSLYHCGSTSSNFTSAPVRGSSQKLMLSLTWTLKITYLPGSLLLKENEWRKVNFSCVHTFLLTVSKHKCISEIQSHLFSPIVRIQDPGLTR